jgi:hypothetical protein
MENVINLVSSFINNIFSFPVVILLIAIIFKKPIYVKILSLKKLSGNGMEVEFSVETRNISRKIDDHEKNKNQTAVKQVANDFENSNNPEIAIPRIYSTIETAVKDKFNVSASYNMLIFLFQNKIINADTFIIMDSMRSLRDNIHSFVRSQEITMQDIDNYERNAERIIKIIQAI